MSAEAVVVQAEEEGRVVARAELRGTIRGGERCDACGEPMQPMGHCKWLCRCCGFLRTCIDTI
jgi:hypothetical protein